MEKILFLITDLRSGGAEKVLVNLVNNLDHNKYEITLFSIFDCGINRHNLNANVKYKFKFKYQFRGNSHLFKLFTPKQIFNWLIKEEHDILVAYLEGLPSRIIAGGNEKTRKIAWIHIELNNKKLAAKGFINIQEAIKCYKKFDEIIGVSENVIEHFKENISNRIRSRVIYNTIESEDIISKSNENLDFDFSEKTLNICSVAKVTKAKGYDRLIVIHKKLIEEGYNHVIHIIGDGKDRKKLEKQILKMGLQDSFKFLGFQENPYNFMKNCDLYVCSSRREGFSTAVTEALILGIPVVSTNCSGAKELLGKNNEYGVVTNNNTQDLYLGIKDILNCNELLNHYKKQAIKRGALFSKKNTLEAVEKLLENK